MSLRSGPKLIIIDDLDGCGTGKVRRYVLTVIQEIPLSISFPVAGRPDQIIRDAFHAEPLGSVMRRLALNDSYRPDGAFKLFFQSKFDEISPLRDLPPLGWPSDFELLQFIYASK